MLAERLSKGQNINKMMLQFTSVVRFHLWGVFWGLVAQIQPFEQDMHQDMRLALCVLRECCAVRSIAALLVFLPTKQS
jgi:hypothetical protein